MAGLLAETPDFPAINKGIQNALNGDFSIFNSPSLTPQETLEAIVGQVLVCSDNGEISPYTLNAPELTSSDFPKTFEYFNQSLTAGLANDITGIGLTATWTILVSLS